MFSCQIDCQVANNREVWHEWQSHAEKIDLVTKATNCLKIINKKY